MNKTERLMHLKKLEAKLSNWKKDFNSRNSKRSFLEIIKNVSIEISLGILVTSGKDNPICYCGPYYKCKKLQNHFGKETKMEAVGYYWCWVGCADPKDVKEIVFENNSKVYHLQTYPTDVKVMGYYLADKLSYDNRFGDENKVMTYIGNRAICTRLLHQYHGKIGRYGDVWHWIGTKITFAKLDTVIYSYRKNAKRCNKKGLVKD